MWLMVLHFNSFSKYNYSKEVFPLSADSSATRLASSSANRSASSLASLSASATQYLNNYKLIDVH